MLEGFRREASLNDLWRRKGINPRSCYSRTKEFMKAGKEWEPIMSLRDVES